MLVQGRDDSSLVQYIEAKFSGLMNCRDGGPLSSLLVNKYLGQMDTCGIIIPRKTTSCYFGLVVAQYWIYS